jgi:hypothetical protein
MNPNLARNSMLDPRRALRITAAALGLLLPAATAMTGCIADESILEQRAALEPSLKAECAEFLTEGTVAELTTGEACPGNGSCAYGTICSSGSADCLEPHGLVVNETSVLECPSNPVSLEFVPPPDHDPWVDCEAALRDGQSGQACGAAFTCARIAGTCCIELASCGIVYPDLSDDGRREPSQHLIRMRTCTQNCQNLTPDESAVATDCASAYTQRDPFQTALGRRCSGEFVCINGIDVRGGVAHGIDYTSSNDFAFCQGGVVLGRTGSHQPPTLWSLL